MKLDFSKKSNYFYVLLAALLVVAAGVYTYFNLDGFSYSPFKGGPELSSPVYSIAAESGEQFFIDQGNFRIVAVDRDGTCSWTYINTDASYKEIAQAPDGGIFVTNYQYVNEAAISGISIDAFSPSGDPLGSVYTVSYTVAHVFDRTSQIMDLRFADDALDFVTRTDDELILYSIRLNDDHAPRIKASVPWDDREEHAIKYSYDHERDIFYVITALGNIYGIAADGREGKLLPYPKGDGLSIPYALTIAGDLLVVSDIGSRTVMAYDGQTFTQAAVMKNSDDFFADPALYYSIASAGGGRVILTSGWGVQLLDVGTGETAPVNTDIRFSGREQARIIFTWLSGLFLLLAAGTLMVVFAVNYYKKSGVSDFAYNFMMIVIVIAVSALIIANYTTITYNAYQDSAVEKISSIGSLIAENISPQDVSNINSMDDYSSQSYRDMISFLNKNFSVSGNAVYSVGEEGLTQKDTGWYENIYLGINRIIDGRLYFAAAMPEEAGVLYPLDVADSDGISLLLQKNTLIYPDYEGYFGSYCLILVPIITDDGEVVGTVEVGFNKDDFMKEMRTKQQEIIFAVAVVLILCLLLLKEIFFFIKSLFSKRSLAQGELIHAGSVRTPMFLGLTAYSISIVCGPLFAMQLYDETFGFSKEIAVAIAYSATLLFVGIFAFVSGSLVKKVSIHRLIAVSSIIAIAGELTASGAAGLTQFIIGRCIFGAGAGMILNALDTMVAMQPNEERVTQGFAMSSAGAQAGRIFGVGIGAAVMLNFGYRGVYIVSAVVLALLFITTLLLYSKHNLPSAANWAEENAGTSFLSFVKHRRVIGYALLIAVPYFLCLGFIDYFLPLQGQGYGLSEQEISYIVIGFGLIAIFFGPYLTKKLMSMFPSYVVLIISTAVVSAAILYYGLDQSIFGLVLACVAFAFADSFFQSVQNIYLTQLPESIRYGQGSTLAFSNIVIGIAQMGQSYLFALAIIFGVRNAMIFIGGGFFLLTALFLLVNLVKKGETA